MSFPTRNIPDLRAARKLASHLSSTKPNKMVDVTQDSNGYRLSLTQVPSHHSLGTFKNGRPYNFAAANPIPDEVVNIAAGVTAGILAAGLVTWLFSKLTA